MEKTTELEFRVENLVSPHEVRSKGFAEPVV
jgi:hypothetical protein